MEKLNLVKTQVGDITIYTTNTRPHQWGFYVGIYNKTSDKTALELVHDITFAIRFWNNELVKAGVNIRVARTPNKMNNHIRISFADDKTAPKKFGNLRHTHSHRVNGIDGA